MTRSILLLILFHVQCCTVPAENDPILADINGHRESLQKLGLVAFSAECRAADWKLPWMPSKWRWANIKEERERRRVEASRALGLDLLIQIEKGATEARAVKVSDKNADEARLWLDLAEWCAATRGYGNLIIARRCADIAKLPLGRIAVDENVKIDLLLTFEPRTKTAWDSPEERRRILNEEAEAEVFPVGKEQDMIIHETWRCGVWAMSDQLMPGLTQSLPKEFRHEPTVKLTAMPVQGLKFFKDEDSLAELITTKQWDVKHHMQILHGGIQINGFLPVQNLINYRKALGSFPRPPFKRSPFYEGIKGAFDEEWRAIAHNYPKLAIQTGLSAWSAYDRITRGEIVDDDYLAKRLRKVNDTQ